MKHAGPLLGLPKIGTECSLVSRSVGYPTAMVEKKSAGNILTTDLKYPQNAYINIVRMIS